MKTLWKTYTHKHGMLWWLFIGSWLWMILLSISLVWWIIAGVMFLVQLILAFNGDDKTKKGKGITPPSNDAPKSPVISIDTPTVPNTMTNPAVPMYRPFSSTTGTPSTPPNPPSTKSTSKSPATPTKTAEPREIIDIRDIPAAKRLSLKDISDGWVLRYCYEEKINTSEKMLPTVFEHEITFTTEQLDGNRYISTAFIEGLDIGTLEGRTAKMLFDWERRGEPVSAIVISIKDSCVLRIGFYKLLEKYKQHTCKLVKLAKKDSVTEEPRKEHLIYCSEGDIVMAEKDYEGNYVVTDDSGYEIGELSARTARLIDDEDVEKVIGTIESIIDDGEKVECTVSLYLVT